MTASLLNPNLFCPVPFWNMTALISGMTVLPPESYGVHLWNESWRRNLFDRNADYDPLSLYERLKTHYLGRKGPGGKPMRSRRLMNEINVVPYIDVMLVLLVIFMVTAPMIQTGSVDLPSVGKSSQPPVAPLEVIIKADSSLALRDRAKGSAEQVVTRADLAGGSRKPRRPIRSRRC
jgi:hypothetical protein